MRPSERSSQALEAARRRRELIEDRERAMVCEHLIALEREMLARGIKETYRGQAWSRNCREWVYFECRLDLPALRARLHLAPCVVDHVHRGTHDGSEAGLVCSQCWDAIMGVHPTSAADLPDYR